MTQSNKPPKKSQKPLVLAIVIVAGLAFAGLLAVIISAAAPANGTADTGLYAAEVAAALAGADASIGAELVASKVCAACHLAADSNLAPAFTGLADVAGQRRPPLSAAAYLYEAILFPAAHLVDGYTDSMPRNYAEELSQSELGHIIAYLLTLTAANGSP